MEICYSHSEERIPPGKPVGTGFCLGTKQLSCTCDKSWARNLGWRVLVPWAAPALRADESLITRASFSTREGIRQHLSVDHKLALLVSRANHESALNSRGKKALGFPSDGRVRTAGCFPRPAGSEMLLKLQGKEAAVLFHHSPQRAPYVRAKQADPECIICGNPT